MLFGILGIRTEVLSHSYSQSHRATNSATLTRLAVLMFILTGCSGAPTAESLPTDTSLPPSTHTQVPTATLPPTDTVAPTATALPTATPTVAPSPTPVDASTPEETSTPTFTPTPENTPTPEVELTSIGAITAERLGQEVSVEGTVVDASSFSQGFTFTLDDGTGQVVLLMWHDVYDNCWDADEISLGATVRATGEIGQYEGELQIEPDFGGDVKVIAAPTAVSVPRREIGSLSSDDEGQRVMIEGDVIRVEGGGSWVKVFVGDGTGEVMVFMFRNVLDRVPNNTALGTPGSRVRIVGPVEVYKGNLEIVPTLPYDVTVLSE